MGDNRLTKAICIVGVGHLGSMLADPLARMGKNIVAVDYDRVEAHNLENQAFFHEEVGTPKVEALANRLNHLHRGRVLPIAFHFEHLDVRQVLADTNLVICVVDAPLTRMNVARVSRSLHLPVLFAGMDVLGNTGELLYQSTNSDGACWGCHSSNEDPPVSCEVVRDPTAMSLGFHIVAHTLSTTLSIISGSPPTKPLLRLRANGDSVWVDVARRPGCKVCPGAHYLRS